MTLYNKIEDFLKKSCPSSAPLLLALSGGADSLYLFHFLLDYRERQGTPFHVAHVDHGWREESGDEAKTLEQLAVQHQVPFHLKTLEPSEMKGNQEAMCREARYRFFADLSKKHLFQGVLTGHHRDDLAETIFKRLLEGAHWSHWEALKPESWLLDIRVLRPLLKVSKQELMTELNIKKFPYFEDPTNQELHYLRARIRHSIFPKLNQEFGKEIKNSLIEIGQEAQQLTQYFECKTDEHLRRMMTGPWGTYLELRGEILNSLLEIKFLIRRLANHHHIFLSRQIIEDIARAIAENQANHLSIMGKDHIWTDRRKIFFLRQCPKNEVMDPRSLSLGRDQILNWQYEMKEVIYGSQLKSSWKEGWQGSIECCLPHGNYSMVFLRKENQILNLKQIKKIWSQYKVPSFLYHYFPLILRDGLICHDFLTGKSFLTVKEGFPCYQLSLSYQPNCP